MNRLSILLLLLLGACVNRDIQQPMERLGYVPVYASANVINHISVEPVRPTTAAGKIYAYGAYLFQVEQFEGIHIIDNRAPTAAKKVAFLKVPMCTEIAVKSNFLYTNNLNDLVVFDLGSTTTPVLVQRLANAFPQVSQTYPPFSGVYFECPDPAKGIVVRWEQKNLTNPSCRR